MSDPILIDRSLGYRPSDPEWRDNDALTLDPADICTLTDTETLAALDSLRKLCARAGAVEAGLLARFAQLRDGALGAEDEVAYTLHTTRHQAADRLVQARQLVQRHPMLLAAMRDGHVEPYPASRVLDLTTHLDDDTARHVDERLAGKLVGKNPTEVRRVARRAVHAADPDGLTDRARRARVDRKVALVHGEDSMSRLIADLPAEAAAAAYTGIDTEARRLRRHGEHRSLDQLRADILTDRLIHPSTAASGTGIGTAVSVGGSPASIGSTLGAGSPGGSADATHGPGIPAMVYLHMPIDAALGIGDDGCELAGYGPIPGAIARHIMANPHSTWRKVICDPATGAPLDLGRRRYRPNTAIREIIHARDRECAVPGCHRTAQHCAFDHVQSRRSGGDTSVANGEAACTYHNNLKEEPGWRIDFDHAKDTVTITTPTGQRITRQRRPVLTPRPPAAPSTAARSTTAGKPPSAAGPQQPTGPPKIPDPRPPEPGEPPF